MCVLLCPGKKDSEGWETVQRGRPARPRSAIIVAKVSPVLAHISPKDDSNKENQQLLDRSCPLDKDKGHCEQPIPEEPVPLEETAGDLEKGNMEVLSPDVAHPPRSPQI